MLLLYFSDFMTNKLSKGLDMLLHLFILIGFFYFSYKGYKVSKEEDYKADLVDYVVMIGFVVFVIKMSKEIFF